MIAERPPARRAAGIREAPASSLADARSALASEWTAADPRTPTEIDHFYRTSRCQEADQDAWHQGAGRQSWTRLVVEVAQQIGARHVVDIGCGAGHDLAALREALPDAELWGAEPNERQRERACKAALCNTVADAQHAPLEEMDLLLCLDVLEHLPDPEAFLRGVATRARLGAVLVEATATGDCGTPLHLASNRGWHPGRALDAAGWALLEQQDRVRVWQRAAAGRPSAGSASLLLVSWRGLHPLTAGSVEGLRSRARHPKWPGMRWGTLEHSNDALLCRARSAIASRWWAQTADDVCLFVDSDIVFDPAQAESMAEKCRDGCDVICGAYPVRDGSHLALRGWDAGELAFGPGLPPVEIRWAPTGFLAIHRRVLDALIPTLPLVHGNSEQPWWPLFQTRVVDDELAGGANYLSEDWEFSERCREAGFRIWLDPSVRLGHVAEVVLTVGNMTAISAAIKEG